MPNTPPRYAPSTPHALRALQQQSARKTRSARTVRTLKAADRDVVRPDSARGILRRLAKITTQSQKGIDESLKALSGAVVVDKENVQPADENDGDGEEEMLKKPRLTLDIENEDESLDVDVSELPEGYEDEEDTEELPAVPTPSILPDDDDDDTHDVEGGEKSVTFKAIDFAIAPPRSGQPSSERAEKRKSRLSFAQLRSVADEPDDEDDDPSMLTERGRRAISEEMTGRLSRYSFGSIRMSDFGEDLEVRRESDPRFQAKLNQAGKSLGPKNDILLEGETELLDKLRNSIPQSPVDDEEDDQGPLIGDDEDEDFQLFVPEEDVIDVLEEAEIEEAAALQVGSPDQLPQPDHRSVDEVEAGPASPSHQPEALSPKSSRRLTILETSALATQTIRRKRRQKMTRHGAMVPSLPSSLIKRIATESCIRNGRRRPQLGKDHVAALDQASEWFFEQIGADIAAYAEHGKRKKKVDRRDVLTLMRRQRVNMQEVKILAGEVLPEDVAAELALEDDDA